MDAFGEMKRNTKILIIEDNPAHSKTLASILKRRQFQTFCCKSGEEALNSNPTDTFNIAILDLHLPDMYGLEMLDQLKNHHPRIKIIIRTGYASLQSAMTAVNQGAFAFLKKEGDVEELLDHINRAQLAWYSESLEQEIQNRNEELMKTNVTLKHEILERQQAEEKILQLNQQLERRVEERTQKLQLTLDQLKQTQDRLIVQEKLASLSTLTAGIAHEMKNPLNFVINFSDLSLELIQEIQEVINVKKEQYSPQERETIKEDFNNLVRFIEITHKHGERIQEIISSMLLHARKDHKPFEKTPLHPLLENNLNMVLSTNQSTLSIPITIEKDFDETIKKIPVVPQDLGRAFLNIFDNTFHATEEKFLEKGETYVPTVRLSTRDLNNQVEIRIWDNGPGIPEKNLDKIFDPFFSMKPPGSGTGLGLSISYDIVVQEHHGSFQVQSKEGEFTEFIVTLPKNI